MEPRIQYTTTSDGVKIAYWTLGEGGTPLLMTTPLGFSNISVEWSLPEFRVWYERLANRRMIVRFDSRNTGISDRGVQDLSFDAHVSDIEAVAGALSLGRVHIMAFLGPAMFAISWAARRLERIERLVLWSPYVHNPDVVHRERFEAVMSLAERDWELATETFAHWRQGWSEGPLGHEWAKFNF